MQLDGCMSKPSPARYRMTNWSSYMASLRKRGLLLIWLHKDRAWLAPPVGKPGRPALLPTNAIQCCLTIKVLFKLVAIEAPLVQATTARGARCIWPWTASPRASAPTQYRRDIDEIPT